MNNENSFGLEPDTCWVTSKRSSRRGGKPKALCVSALSAGEWNYLRGLFLADGSKTAVPSSGLYVVRFFLQWNEGDMAHKVAELLSRAGLNPNVREDSGARQIIVRVCSKALFGFLPDKKALREKVGVRERFLVEHELLTRDRGVPFLAGLLDGDGHVGVAAVKRRALFGIAQQWSFKQSALPFLVDYVVNFVNSLTPNGAGISTYEGSKRLALIHKSGKEALLGVGIASHSWKAAQWLKKLRRLRREVKMFYTVRQVAEKLGVSTFVVKGFAKDGKLHIQRIGTKVRRWCYIPVDDFERFRVEFLGERENAEKVMGEGMKLTDVARLLGVSPKTLHWMYRSGRLQARVVCEGRQKYLVITREEVERLKHKLDPRPMDFLFTRLPILRG